jgi:hypothetical protein
MIWENELQTEFKRVREARLMRLARRDAALLFWLAIAASSLVGAWARMVL